MFTNSVQGLKEQLGAARQQKVALADERTQKIKELDAIEDDFSPEGKRKYDKLLNEIKGLNGQLTTQESTINDIAGQLVELGENANWQDQPVPTAASTGGPDVETWKAVSDEHNGKEIKVLGTRGSLKAFHQPAGNDNRDMAAYLRDRVRGFTKNGFSNAMDTDVDSALVPAPLAAGLIDKARNKSRIFQAGARTVDMTSKTLTIAKTKKDADADWKAENASHSASDVSFEKLTFTAKTLIATVKSSVELAEDSGNLASLVENDLAAAIALKLDSAALLGDGTGSAPTGIINTDNVQSKKLATNGAALTDYSEFSLAVQNIMAKNGTPNAVIFSPRTWGTIDRLVASDNQPLMAPQSYQNLEKYQTEQIPTDLTVGTSNKASLAIVGDWSQLMIGVRTKLRLEVSRVAADSDGSAFSDLQIWFRAYARYDVQLAHPEMFYIINGIIPAS